jgi:hypothetical protein
MAIQTINSCTDSLPLENNRTLSQKETNANFIFFDLTQPGLEPTVYRTRGEHANRHTTDAVDVKMTTNTKIFKNMKV